MMRAPSRGRVSVPGVRATTTRSIARRVRPCHAAKRFAPVTRRLLGTFRYVAAYYYGVNRQLRRWVSRRVQTAAGRPRVLIAVAGAGAVLVAGLLLVSRAGREDAPPASVDAPVTSALTAAATSTPPATPPLPDGCSPLAP